jgi:Mg2+ and Co2+ transporter CorA
MKIYCYSIEENGSLASLPGEDWQRHREETKSPLWVHIEGGSVDQVHEVLAPLALHKLLLGMIDDRDSFGSRIIPWDNALLLILPTLVKETQSTSTYSASLLLDDLLITLVQSTSERLNEFTHYLGTGIKLFTPTTSALVCAQLIFQNHLRVQQALTVRNRTASLIDMLEKDPDAVTVGDILDLRSQIRVMDADAEDQVYCIELMGPMDSPAFSVKGIEDYYQTLLTNSRYLDRFTNRLDERIKDLSHQYTLYVQEKTNRKLAVLTVISAIFLPLTLLAGIYGMNFSAMPELGWEYGYPAVLLLMGAIAAGLVWVFKRKSWFD